MGKECLLTRAKVVRALTSAPWHIQFSSGTRKATSTRNGTLQSWTETAFQLQKAKQPRTSQHPLARPIRGLATVHALGLWTQPYRGTHQGPLKTRRFLRKNLRSSWGIPQSKSLPSHHSQNQRYS